MGTGFPKGSCSNKKIERDDDSKKCHLALGRRDGPVLLARDGAIDGIDQDLGLDEFGPRPLGLVAIEGAGQRFGKGVAVFGHALARLFQRLKSLAHSGFRFRWSRLPWRERYRPPPVCGIRLQQSLRRSVGPKALTIDGFLAHPTRFERVTFAFGGQKKLFSRVYPSLLNTAKRLLGR